MLRYPKAFITVLILYSLLFVYCQTNQHPVVAKDIRLVTHNVWYGFTQQAERKSQWLEWMTDQQPDIVALQELNEYSPEQLQQDAETWGHSNSVLLKETGFPTGITSRFPITDVQRMFDGFHHGLLRVKIEDMFVYVIHLHPSNWEFRRREVHILLNDIKTLPPDAPVVLVGDFNTFSPADSVYYANSGLEPFFAQRDTQYSEKNLSAGKLDYQVISTLLDYGFVDLEYEHRPDDYQFTGTFPTRIEKTGDHGDQRRLDYVFVNKMILPYVQRAYIAATDTTWLLSDHLPVIVDFNK